MNHDLGALIKAEPHRFAILGIQLARLNFLTLHLFVIIDEIDGEMFPNSFAEIICTNAVDYSIRPADPNCIRGGPAMKFHEDHALISTSLQAIPGGDGKIFKPPIQFCVLFLDQSYVIAERFEIRAYQPDIRVFPTGNPKPSAH